MRYLSDTGLTYLLGKIKAAFVRKTETEEVGNYEVQTVSTMDAEDVNAVAVTQLDIEASLRSMLEGLRSAGVISAYTMTWDSTTAKWVFTISS